MRQFGSGIKIGALVLAAAAVGYYAWKSVGTQPSGNNGYTLWAKFRDASGLPENSRVMVAGLPVGEISERSLLGRKAKLTVRLRRGTKIYENAGIYKKSSSLLGEYYLDIDPGFDKLKDGSDARLLEPGEEIQRVYEATSTDDVLVEVRHLAIDTRALLNGPIQRIADNLDRSVERDTVVLDRIMDNIERITSDLKSVTAGSDAKVHAILDNANQVTKDLQDLIAATKGEVTATGSSVREKLDRIDSALVGLEDTFKNSASITKKIDDPDQGTLGRLVNDPTIANNIEEITEDVSDFVKTAFGLKTVVGIRYEYFGRARASKTAISVQLFTRPDKFYLIEVVNEPRGKIKEELVFDPAAGELTRTTVVDPAGYRISFQFAKIMKPFTFRIGVIESSGGIGADVHLFDDRLKLTVDGYDATFNDWPRIRFMAAYNFFRYFYIYGGIDDVMNAPGERDIIGESLFGLDGRQYTFGRDYFAGLMISFTDEDLSSLLFIGGSAIAATL